MHALTLAHGESALTAALIPLSVDGMIVASSMTLLADSRLGHAGGLLPWLLLAVGSAASLAANVAVAEPTVYGRVVAAWPSFALIGAYELLMRQIRNSASRPLPARGALSPADPAVGQGAADQTQAEVDNAAVSGSVAVASSRREQAAPREATVGRRRPARPAGVRMRPAGAELLAAAQRIDAAHRAERGRPASAETLRTALRVGAATARQLKDAIRTPPRHTDRAQAVAKAG
jgi:Protein of unknown function (DUF2637)